MTIYLEGLKIKGYRGIGSSEETLAPFCRFNFFIGANNVGKSTILKFISEWLALGTAYNQINQPSTKIAKEFDALDLHAGSGERVYGAVAINQNRFLEAAKSGLPKLEGVLRQWPGLDVGLMEVLTQKTGYVWISLNLYNRSDMQYYNDIDLRKVVTLADRYAWNAIWHNLTNMTGGDLLSHWIPDILRILLHQQSVNTPLIIFIPAIRQIGPKGDELSDNSGRGLIDRLAELQNPNLDRLADKVVFGKINDFLRSVTDDHNATIEIPHDRSHILIHMDNRVLPLDSLGTGIHEVIMIAAFCTLNNDKIVCIEEPEIHLHPLLQRKLISYLSANTTNQYFIATHSAAFINTAGSAIFFVTKENGLTKMRESILRRDRLSICSTLGYQASDILQSNCVIWVEGPSDRIYIRWWLQSLAPQFVEGIHYSIMFYGGRLLSHLSADDEEVREFIDLRSMNQHLAIVIDSDKSSAHKHLNATKQRLQQEFSKGTGVGWVTKGREIENYIDHDVLQAAVRAVYNRSYIRPDKGGQFDHALNFVREMPKTKKEELFSEVDKVKVAAAVANNTKPNFKLLDLDEKLAEIIAMIQDANP